MDILTLLMLIVLLIGGLTLTLITGLVAFVVLLPIEDIWDLIS
jgi:hypothetical protein